MKFELKPREVFGLFLVALGLQAILLIADVVIADNRQATLNAVVGTAERDDAAQKFLRTCGKLTAADEIRACGLDAIKSAREGKREEEDVAAQKEMALWAKWMVYVSLLTFAATSIGTALLVQTVRAATDANIINKAQVRGYLKWKSGSYSIQQGSMTAQLYFDNKGASPTNDVRFTARVKSLSFLMNDATDSVDVYERTSEYAEVDCSNVSPGDDVQGRLLWTSSMISQEHVEELYQGGDFTIEATVAYRDVFGDKPTYGVTLSPKGDATTISHDLAGRVIISKVGELDRK